MRRVLKLLVGATLLLASVLPPAVAGAAAEEETAMRLQIDRTRWGIDLHGCVPSLEPTLEGGAGFSASGVSRTHVNGALVAESDSSVSWVLPWLEPDPACPNSVYFHQRITAEQLASLGIAPDDGEWVTFDIEVEIRVTARATPFVARRAFTIGAGPPIGAVTSTRSTSEGTYVRGWVVHPSVGAMQSLTVTVDGRKWTPAPTYPLPWYNGGVFATNRATSDPRWVDRGLGAWQDFELLVPPGRTCVFAPDARIETFPATPIGCATSVTDGRARAIISKVEPLSAPGAASSPVRLRGTVSDPWASSDERPQLTLVAGTDRYPVEATPARDLRGPLSDGTGAFRFDHTFPSVPPGNVRFCVVASYGTASTWWLQFIGPPKSVDRELTCSTVYVPSQVPRAPLGVLDRVDVSGRSVTAQGWAFDPNGGSPRVLLAVNGFPAAIGRTGLRRPDVARAVGGNGDAGFALSAELEAGTHDVCTLWEDTTTGRWSTPTCRQTVVK